ncbi:hypothetical protein X747_14105 [Mesorhizobium sp. LNJC384A00]|nr:hypothetical protein X749_03660 [Mesorhizobium sp. LNJC391B00]ESY41979.1 hypothetical protein X747_14105 [Mesorhizobium sp. LNJC384A00]
MIGETMYTLTFTEEQMAVLDRAPQDVPFKFAMPIIQSINEQLVKQRDPAKEAEEVKNLKSA